MTKIMGDLNQNLRWAWDAVNYTTRQLNIGRGNSVMDNLSYMPIAAGVPLACVTIMRLVTPDAQTVAQIARRAESFGCGNCGEQAAVAIMYLHRRRIIPLDYMNLTNGDHAFVVIGRLGSSNVEQVGTWGADAVICDPWSRQAYSAAEYNHNMRSMSGGHNPVCRSLVRQG